MDSKLVIGIMIALIVGVGAGYLVFDNSEELETAYSDLEAKTIELENITSDCRIMRDRYLDLKSDFSVLQVEYETLTDVFSDLDTQYGILMDNNVPRNTYETISSQAKALTEENNQLTTNLTLLQVQHDSLEAMYNALYADFQIVNSPQSQFTSLGDLEITLTTDKTVYNYTRPITGNVSIYFKTGEPFEGSFELNMAWEGASGGKGLYTINGQRNYSIIPPNSFSAGPGEYILTVAWIKDKDGYYIHTGRIDSTAITLEAK